jgi:flavin reductase (DIM6/NTAB) family NADH-FMN oxidoreductase RutF
MWTALVDLQERGLKKRQLGPCVTFFPQPATLVATRDDQNKINLMMASWVGIVSKTPPTLAISLHRNRKTYANIMSRGVFSINSVTSELVVAADACGLVSGQQVDKCQITSLEISSGVLEGNPLIAQSPLNVECRFLSEIELGDYCLVLGEIAEIHARDSAFDGQGKADISAFDPLVYLGGLREYWSLGEKRANAYSAGLALLGKEEA